MTHKERIEELEAALRYIACPTMAYGDTEASPADFAQYHAEEQDVRLALRTCIEIAQMALAEGPRSRVAIRNVHTVNVEDDGCGVHVCDECDVMMPMGRHEPEDHEHHH
jgi:hypothetical protein